MTALAHVALLLPRPLLLAAFVGVLARLAYRRQPGLDLGDRPFPFFGE